MVSRVYWDSCCFISLIQQESGRYEAVQNLYDEAEKGGLVIHTSALTLSEVCRVRCDEGAGKPRNKLGEDGDAYLDRFFDNDFFQITEVSPTIGVLARTLYRRHPEIKITNDAVHLATAVIENVEEMHTYDGNDLLKLSGLVMRLDGNPLTICVPSENQPTLFTKG